MPKRDTVWLDTIVSVTAGTGASTSVDLLGTTLETEARGYTLVRTIISLEALNSTYAGHSGRQAVSLGIGMMEREAAASGAFPDPGDPTDAPGRGWVWRDTRVVLSVLDTPGEGWPYTRFAADLRGMRKVMYAEPVLVFDNDALDGVAFTVRVRGIIRSLYKLP